MKDPENKKVYKEAGVGIFYSAVSIGCQKGGELVARVLLARMLALAGFGIASLSLAVLFVAVPLVLLGTEEGIVRFVAQYTEKGDRQSAAAFVVVGGGIALVVGAMAALLLIVGSAQVSEVIELNPGLLKSVTIIAILVIPTALSRVIRASLAGLRRMHHVALMNAAEKIALVITLVVMGVMGVDSYTIALQAYLVAAAVGVIVGGLVLARGLSLHFKLTQIRVRGRELLGFSWRLSISSVLNQLRIQGELMLLALFATAASVGEYSAATLVAGTLLLPVLAGERVILAISSGLYSSNRIGEIRDLYRLLARWLFMFGVVAYGAVLLAAPELMEFVFGVQYRSSWPTLIVAATASLVSLTAATQGSLNYAFGNTRVVLIFITVGAVVGLGLTAILTPHVGIVGAASARVAAMLASELIGVIAIFRMHRIQPLQLHHLYLLGIGGVCCAGVWLIQGQIELGWSTAIFVFTVVTLFITFVTHAMPTADLQLLRGLLSRRGRRSEGSST
jgi:O-antigen/teichoic acid export membrane protein